MLQYGFFVCRFHPLTNFNKLYKVIDLKKKLPKNIVLSNSNLEKTNGPTFITIGYSSPSNLKYPGGRRI